MQGALTCETQTWEVLLREAISSDYRLFDITREILHRHGPTMATPKGEDTDLCFGFPAVSLLNTVIRPILAKYHPLLEHHESKRKPNCSPFEHERQWKHYKELRKELEKVRRVTVGFANLLAEVTGVRSLIID